MGSHQHPCGGYHAAGDGLCQSGGMRTLLDSFVFCREEDSTAFGSDFSFCVDNFFARDIKKFRDQKKQNPRISCAKKLSTQIKFQKCKNRGRCWHPQNMN